MSNLPVNTADIPRGNTSKGVNSEILGFLAAKFERMEPLRLLDLPCGNGEFLDAFLKLFPGSSTVGADIDKPANFKHNFFQIDAARSEISAAGQFDIVTCISGVMEFDNTLAFFERIKNAIEADGHLIVTNDNVLTVKDRLLYLLSGRFSQYPFHSAPGTPTWKIIPIQNLLRIVQDAGFRIESIKYVPVLGADWLWAVVAVPLYLLDLVTHSFGNRNEERRAVFSLRSFLSRHYILVCCPEIT